MSFYNILLIDNELSNLKALERTLRPEYNIFSATNSEDALTIMEQKDIALVIAEYRMPGMTSVELLERALKEYPDTILIVLTGYTDEHLLVDAIDAGRIYAYINKPWEPEEMRAIVRDGMEACAVIHASKEHHVRVLLHSGIISKEQLEVALKVQKSKEKSIGEILLERNAISRGQLDTAMELQRSSHKQLDEILVELGAISPDDLEVAIGLQRHGRRKLVEIFIDLGYADEESIYSCYALQLGMPHIMISQISNQSDFADLVTPELACKYTIVPLDSVGRVLVVAAFEPLSDRAKAEIEEEIGCRIMYVYASSQDVQTGLEQYCDVIQREERMQEVMGAKTIEIGLEGSVRFYSTGDTIECLINDITEDCKNIMVVSSNPGICKKEDVDLQILVPVERSPIRCGGEIVWCSETDEKIARNSREHLARIFITDISRIDERRLDLIVAQRRAFNSGN